MFYHHFFDVTIPEDKTDRVCFNLILFDLFFIPLFPWFSASVSLPVLAYWYLKRGSKIRFEREYKYFFAICLLMGLSTIANLIYDGDTKYETTFVTAVKLFFMFVTSFLYYFFFRYCFTFYKRRITNLVFGGIIYISIFALFYLLSPESFNTFKGIVCPFDPQVLRWASGGEALFRYNFLWADPNNVAYATTALSLFYIIEEKDNIINKYFVMILTVFVLLCTMSIGGIGVAFVLIGYLFLFTKEFRTNAKSVAISVFIILLSLCVVFYYYDVISNFVEQGLFARTEIYDNTGLAGGGGRKADFLSGLHKFDPLFFIIGSGQEGFVTEIGHWYIVFLYGIPVYIYVLYVFYKKGKSISFKEYLPIIPFFVGFTMNIAIIEQKFMLLNLLIAAYYSSLSALRQRLS